MRTEDPLDRIERCQRNYLSPRYRERSRIALEAEKNFQILLERNKQRNEALRKSKTKKNKSDGHQQ